MFSIILDKSSKKFECPNCTKKTFVRYKSVATNDYFEHQYGRCDRETNCGYHLRPNAQNKISFVQKIVPLKQSFLDKMLISKCGKNFDKNNFIRFLRIYFSKQEVDNAILNFCIGTSKHWIGSTVFWQINEKEQLFAGKIMLFDRTSGKRIKKPYTHISWVHSVLKIKDFELKQCLFGLHQIIGCSNKTIAIVESEKTAVIMSILLPTFIWMATGSRANLKVELLKPIKNFTIIFYPDKSEFDDWSKKSVAFNAQGYKTKCSDYIENIESENGFDLVDLFLKQNETKTENKKEYVQTEAEKQVSKLAKINPNILKLIKVFDLVDKNHNPIINIT